MITKVLESIYRIELPIPFPLKTTNVYLVDESPRTLVDTGIKTDASFETLREGLHRLGMGPEQIERILITHGHIDHYGQAKRLASLSGAPIYIHSKEYGRIRSILHSLGLLKSVLLRNGVPKDLTDQTIRYIESAQRFADPLEEAFFLDDGESIPFRSATWITVHCPGHSPGLLCFHWPEKKVVFTGDHLLKEITPNPILSISETVPSFRYAGLRHYLNSLEKIERLEPALLLPGHGEVIDDPKRVIRKIIAHHQERAERVAAILSKGSKTPYEIAIDLFVELPAFDLFLGVSETIGHLEILREQGRIRVSERAGIDVYSLED